MSAIVTFNLLVLPCLKQIMGYIRSGHTEIKVKCDFKCDLDPRPEYHRAFISWPKKEDLKRGDYEFYSIAKSTGNQHSSRLLSMNEANCLVVLPGRSEEKNAVNRGDVLSALIIEKL